MLTEIKILLTYKCSLRCQHCYLYTGPKGKGTIKMGQVDKILEQATKINTIKWVFYSGGEAFTKYPQLLSCIKKAQKLGFSVGVVTNGYFARSEESANRFLRPLVHLGVSEVRISNDRYHYKSPGKTPAQHAIGACQKLGLPVTQICVLPSFDKSQSSLDINQSLPTIIKPLRYQGRATDILLSGLPTSKWDTFNRCPLDDLDSPSSIYIDPFGNMQICPGINIGNVWENSLSNLVADYQVEDHPIYGPIFQGGPALLLMTYKPEHEDEYVDACHLCYSTRLKLRNHFPEYLAPRQVYGLESY